MALSRNKKATYYRRAANTTTYTRNTLGVVVALNVLSGDKLLPQALKHRSIGSGVLVAAIGGLDKLDGYFANKSQQYGMDITPENSSFDSDMDKKNNKVLSYSFGARNVIEGLVTRNPRMLVHAGAIAGYAVWTNNRDGRMTKSRLEAAEGAETKAILLNKWKTFGQNLGHSIESSPLSAVAPEVAEVTYLASCVLGEIGLTMADKVHQTAIVEEIAV